jgi:hypothetical protein
MTKNWQLLATVVVLAFLLSTCKVWGPDRDKDKDDSADGGDSVQPATLTVEFICPDAWDVDHYTVSLAGSAGNQVSETTTDDYYAFADLAADTYDLLVAAYDSTDSLLGRGSGSWTVTEGETLTEQVSVDVTFEKYAHPDYYEHITIEDITITDGDAHIAHDPTTIWKYTLDPEFTGEGLYLWGMNATDPGNNDFSFGFAIDDEEPVLIDEDGETLVFNAADSRLDDGILVFDGFESIPLSNPPGGSQAIAVRLNVAAKDLTGAPLSLDIPSTWNLEPEYGGLLKIAGDFRIEISLDASMDDGATWEPALDLYDALDTVDGMYPRTDIGSAIFVME